LGFGAKSVGFKTHRTVSNYNEETTVEGNNFTAVGYFISARITEEYIQVQVVNVSTGEFEGNVTVNL